MMSGAAPFPPLCPGSMTTTFSPLIGPRGDGSRVAGVGGGAAVVLGSCVVTGSGAGVSTGSAAVVGAGGGTGIALLVTALVNGAVVGLGGGADLLVGAGELLDGEERLGTVTRGPDLDGAAEDEVAVLLAGGVAWLTGAAHAASTVQAAAAANTAPMAREVAGRPVIRPLSHRRRWGGRIFARPVGVVVPVARRAASEPPTTVAVTRRSPSVRGERKTPMMPGMPDLSQLLMQAQQMQADMARAQASLSETEVTGSAGSGAVTAVVNGAGDLLRIRIDPAVVDSSDVETLEDLVVAAVHDARRAAEKVAGEAMGSVAGGLDLSAMGLPAGMGLPGLGGGFGDAVDEDDFDEDDEEEDDEEEDDEEEDDAEEDERTRLSPMPGPSTTKPTTSTVASSTGTS